jgi:hypothetical protein
MITMSDDVCLDESNDLQDNDEEKVAKGGIESWKRGTTRV